jgi:hypothetical protein
MRQQTNALRRTAGEGESQGSLPAVRVHYPEDLERFIPEAEWHVYRGVLRRAAARGLRFAMSGGFASSFYTAMWRNTKDMDLCVVPQDREAMIEATREAGLHDLYEEKPYDRRWIYRSTHEGIIVDYVRAGGDALRRDRTARSARRDDLEQDPHRPARALRLDRHHQHALCDGGSTRLVASTRTRPGRRAPACFRASALFVGRSRRCTRVSGMDLGAARDYAA